MKKILLITTGGTIACSDTNSGRTPESSAAELLESVKELPENVQIDCFSPFCKDSTDMSPREWTALAKHIREKYAEYCGFVITHGTDTLGYAAAALSCLIENSEKPVVLTGSMKPMKTQGSDAPKNLKNALFYAAEESSRGVCAAFDGKIIDGRCAVKVDTESVSAFESVNEREKTHGETRFFDKMDGRVTVVMITPGAEPPIVSENAKAVVILGFGTGGIPSCCGWEEWLLALLSRGVYAVMSTQVLRGGSNLALYKVGSGLLKKRGIIDAGKMTAEYAAMRAMFALAYSSDFESFKRVFLNNNQQPKGGFL